MSQIPLMNDSELNLELWPEGVVDGGHFCKLVDSASASIEGLGDITGRAVSIETSDPFCALIGYLALWRVGAVAVPISTNTPLRRREYMRSKVGTLGSLNFDEAKRTSTECIRVSKHRFSETDTVYKNGAYVLFTSGSSGSPKGVLVSRLALENRIDTLFRELQVRDADQIPSLTNPTFDISLAEVLLPLKYGLKGLFPSRELVADLQNLSQWLALRSPSIIQGTPTLFSLLSRLGWRAPAGSTIWCGGEPLTSSLAKVLLEGGATLWNVYGPTEATIWATAWQVTEIIEGGSIPIGVPFSGSRARIFESEVGEEGQGELWLGGEGLAEGYAGDDDATTSSFHVIEGSRWYRTGDICRSNAKGVLTFLGRADTQIKVRGYRMEIFEVEEEIARVPGVAQVVVIPEAPHDGLISKVIAFVVAPGKELSSLKREVEDSLPPHMLPSRYVLVQTLPTLSSGKIDRTGLRELVNRGGLDTNGI